MEENKKERFDKALAEAREYGLVDMNVVGSGITPELMEFSAKWLKENHSMVVESTKKALKDGC